MKCRFCDNDADPKHGLKCRNCHQIIRRYRVKYALVKYKGGKCENCGLVAPIAVYDFHHRNPEEKEFGLSDPIGYSWERLKNEVEKCDLLCSNCHRMKHDNRSLEIIDEALGNYFGDEFSLEKFEQIAFSEVSYYCNCGNKVSKKGVRCRSCYLKSQEKIDWPSVNDILEKLDSMSYTELSKELGVSGNAIRKRIRHHTKS